MKIIKLLTLFVLFSLHAGATGYSHNMFVAHKKLQAGKDRNAVSGQIISGKVVCRKGFVKVAEVKPEVSFTEQISEKFSGVVTLNQKIAEPRHSSFFIDEEEVAKNSIVNKLVGLVKGIILAFIGSTTFGKA